MNTHTSPRAARLARAVYGSPRRSIAGLTAATIGWLGASFSFAELAEAPATMPATRPASAAIPATMPVAELEQPSVTPVAEAETPAVEAAATPAQAVALTPPDAERFVARATPGVQTAADALLAGDVPARSVRWEPTPAAKPVAAAMPGADAVPATNPLPIVKAGGAVQNNKLSLSTNRTAELRTNGPVKRVSVGQPDIADVQPFGANILLVTAKKPGTTQLIVWDENEQSQSIDVTVEIPLEQLRDLISKVAPTAKVEVGVAADQIVLRGQAPSLIVAKQIGDVAGAFGKVQNFVEVAGAQTVSVQVQFAEVSRTVTNSLGVNFGIRDGTSVFGSQPGGNSPLGWGVNKDSGYVDRLGLGAPGVNDLFGLGQLGSTSFSYFIKALRDNSLLRVLQEPTLTTTSGEPASFLAGGQVAVPVPADNGTIGIEYKEFGVRLLLTPVVLGNGRIKLVMEAESSSLDYANGTTIQGAAVPGLRTRRVQNIVEMGEGQTMSVAGLLDDSVVATKQSVPGLGDFPVIGQLFRSTRYQRKETELVILITPRFSGAMNPGQVPPLPGAQWRHPSELEQFAFGDLGGNKEADPVKDWNKPARDRGLNPPPHGDLEESGRIAASRQGRDPTQQPPTFIGDYGYAPAPETVASVRE